MQAANTIQARRESSSILLLLIVFLSLLRPVSPFIADGIGHTFFSEDHHSKLHQNGYDHLDADFQKLNIAETVDSGKVPVSTFSIETAITFIMQIPQFLLFQNSNNIIFQDCCIALNSRTIKPEIHPPDYFAIS